VSNKVQTENETISGSVEVRDIVMQLNKGLGATLVATLANVRDPKLPYRWARIDGPTPGDESQKRLRAAHDAWNMIEKTKGEKEAKVWFTSENPLFDEDAPVMALREGRLKEVVNAADAYKNANW
jgi:hypothetical protein